MAKKILQSYNFNKNEIQNAVAQVLASDPSTPTEGQFYYSSASKRWLYHNGTAFVADTDRSRHTGTQAWGTLSGTPTTLSGYGITDAVPSAHVGAGGTAHANAVAGGAAGFMSGTDKTKLDSIATGATQNSSDATLLARANHTGTQTAATISDFATAVRTNRLDQMTVPTAALDLNGQRLTNGAAAVSGSDIPTWQQVQDKIAGLSWKDEVRVATTAAGTLASSFANGSTVDGVVLATGDRILVKDQATQTENGLYTVNASGAPTRATDADTGAELAGAAVFVTNGTSNSGQRFVCNVSGTITVGSTNITFASFGGGSSYTAGNGLTLSGNDFNVGAGTGISVAADSVSIDTSVVARKVTALIGNGAAASIAVTHGLGNQWVMAQVIEVATNSVVDCDITMTDANTVTFGFAVAPTTNQYRVVILG